MLLYIIIILLSIKEQDINCEIRKYICVNIKVRSLIISIIVKEHIFLFHECIGVKSSTFSI